MYLIQSIGGVKINEINVSKFKNQPVGEQFISSSIHAIFSGLGVSLHCRHLFLIFF